MKKKLIILCSCVFLSVVSQSCKKDVSKENGKDILSSVDLKSNNAQTKFAVILAKAVSQDQGLRSFLKQESVKQFDKDYDVLYQMIRDEKVDGIATVREKLIHYGGSAKQLDSIEAELPLLTIFVPTLPEFSPEKWNPVTEIPLVAAANIGENNISLYSGSGDKVVLKPNQIPGGPVLVIKQNERLVVNGDVSSRTSIAVQTESASHNIAFRKGNLSFAFANEAFNGVNKKVMTERVVNSTDIDPVNIEAYNSGNEWQRDYVYYGLTASNQKGQLKRNYSEYITSFKFLTPNALGIIADQDEDPRPNYKFMTGYRGNKDVSIPMWTEGNFEFWITVLINARNGIGSQNVYVMSAGPNDLFDVQYKMVDQIKLGFPKIDIKFYEITGITPKEFNPNIRLVPWDLESYGTAWKFIVYEKDNAQTETKTYENETTYAANFGVEFGATAKLGFKFGASATTRNKITHSVATTLTSDFLGEAVVTFDQPIITGTFLDPSGAMKYKTFEIPSGNIYSISIEPKNIFN
ncbi:hypothetical protein DBR43_08260 [Pedobacter sp. KBW06]|uniref:hypothetical protein n=1 Tax=Pedobacter sp. KBW06 TaxID=2153359 RepID=UPI000F59D30E|nr:hypothetical protein [Pedobacter sp. KBW06]RQO75340.1 hypothetical protein DBR43_08260 [Pedobacter sp. KBW06]